MQSAEWSGRTDPPCLVIVIGVVNRTASTGGYGIKRARLFLPAPDAARSEASRALRHYQQAIAGVTDLGDLARRSPVLAWRIFWGLLASSLTVAAVGLWLHLSGGRGDLPAGLSIGGLLGALGVLVVGWARLPRRLK